MSLSQLSVREKILIALALLVALVFDIPALQGMWDTFAGTGGLTVEKVHLQRQQLQQKITQLQESEEQLKGKVAQLGYEQPAETIIPFLVRKIEAQARADQVHLNSLRPLRPRNLEVVTEITLEVQLKADFPNFVRFLYALYDPELKLSIDRVRISSGNEETGEVDVDLALSAYSLKASPTSSNRS